MILRLSLAFTTLLPNAFNNTVNYTIGVYNTEVMKQGLGISLKLNLNKFLLDKRGLSPTKSDNLPE